MEVNSLETVLSKLIPCFLPHPLPAPPQSCLSLLSVFICVSPKFSLLVVQKNHERRCMSLALQNKPTSLLPFFFCFVSRVVTACNYQEQTGSKIIINNDNITSSQEIYKILLSISGLHLCAIKTPPPPQHTHTQ